MDLNIKTAIKSFRSLLGLIGLLIAIMTLSCGTPKSTHTSSEAINQSSNIDFIDNRDNNKYALVIIGEQVWFKENLRFHSSNSNCYKKKKENCINDGRLYPAEELDVICPKGWRVPNLTDWNLLKSTFDSDSINALCDTVNWKVKTRHTNESGFALQGVGFQFAKREFIGKKTATSLWLNQINKFDEYYHAHIYGGDGAYFVKSKLKTNEVLHAHPIENLSDRRFSIRCICNSPKKYIQKQQ